MSSLCVVLSYCSEKYLPHLTCRNLRQRVLPAPETASSRYTLRMLARLGVREVRTLAWWPSVLGYAFVALVALTGCADDVETGGVVTFTAGPTNLSFAASQDGDGPWTILTPSDSGEYAFPVSGSRYGIVAICGDTSNATITLLQATVSETRSPSFGCTIYPAFGSVTGTIDGVPAGQGASVSVAYTVAGRDSEGTIPYTIQTPTGDWDVFARTGSFDTTRVIRKNAVTVIENTPTVVNFDFATEGFAMESHTVALEGLAPGETSEVEMRLRNKPGGTIAFVSRPVADNRYLALPVSELRGDDIHAISATAYAPDDSSFRQVRRWLIAAEDFTATLPAMPPPASIGSETAEPLIRMRAIIPDGFDADLYELVYAQPRSTQSQMTWTVQLTRGYLAAGDVTAYVLPDLTKVDGFDLSWGLTPAIAIQWQVFTRSSDAGVADLLGMDQSAAALDGRRQEITQRAGHFGQQPGVTSR